jgi:hypothetical protein
MRPKTDPSKLFALPRLVRMCPLSDARISQPPSAQPPARSLEELDAFLTERLVRLEISLGCDDAVVLVEAHVVRAALGEAGAYADASSSGPYSCEAELAETLRGIYAWVFGALDALFLGEYVRPLPKRLLGDLHDHGSVASMRSLLDPQQASIEPILLELARACIGLARPRL